jgi:hypothetical protein
VKHTAVDFCDIVERVSVVIVYYRVCSVPVFLSIYGKLLYLFFILAVVTSEELVEVPVKFFVMMCIGPEDATYSVACMSDVHLYSPCIYDMYGVRPVDIASLIDNEIIRKDVNDLIHCRKASLKHGQWPINGVFVHRCLCCNCFIIIPLTFCLDTGKLLATAQLLGLTGFLFDSNICDFFVACSGLTSLNMFLLSTLVQDYKLPLVRVLRLSSENAEKLLWHAVNTTPYIPRFEYHTFVELGTPPDYYE